MSISTARDLVRVVKAAKPLFLQLAGRTGCTCINGFGITFKKVSGKKTDQAAIVFYVSRKLPLRSLPVQNRIPKQINIPWEHSKDGILEIVTDVQAVQFQPLDTNVATERPCPGGFSIGHIDITAGTLGCLVKDKINNNIVILSNNHVLADTNEAALGDPIIQCGSADGGTYTDNLIATLTRFKPIDFSSGVSNYIDAAIATPVNPELVVHKIHDVVGDNLPAATRDITVEDLGQFVKKSGRTTGHTTGYIDTVNATVTVKYGFLQKASFTDQIIIEQALPEEDISAPGDSGSIVLDNDNNLIGLLFAGSERNESEGQPATAIVNPIKHVFNLLNLDIITP